MVRRLLLTLTIAVSTWACSSDDAPKDAEASGSAEITAADTADAKTISFTEAKVDSFVLRYAPGQVLRYRVHQFSEAGPDSAVATTNSTHVYTKKVRAVRSDGSFELTMRFDSVRVDAVVRNRNTGAVLLQQSYTSADSTQRTSEKFVQFNALLGEEISVFVSPRGAILQVGDVSPIVKKMVASAKQEVAPQMIEQLSEQLKAAVYGSFHGQEIIPYPKEKIDASGSWSNAMTTPLAEFFNVSTVASYHIANIKEVKSRRIASIDATIDGSFSVRPIPKDAPFSVKVNSSSITGTSHSLLDVEGGYTISKKNAITMNVSASIVTPKGERRSVSQSQVSRYEIELLP